MNFAQNNHPTLFLALLVYLAPESINSVGEPVLPSISTTEYYTVISAHHKTDQLFSYIAIGVNAQKFHSCNGFPVDCRRLMCTLDVFSFSVKSS